MSRFYASIRGKAENEATRAGTVKSGIQGHVRGWRRGVKVTGGENLKTGNDVFWVWMTGGSNGHEQAVLIAIVEENGTIHKGEVPIPYKEE
jgi:hypothetical protein